MQKSFMKKFGGVLLCALFLSGMVSFPAAAQNEWVSPTPGKSIVGTIMTCLNGSGNAVPEFSAAGAWQCAPPAAVPTSSVGVNFSVPVPITVTVAAYSAGYSEGGLLTVPVARTAGGTGLVDLISLRNANGATNQVYVYLYDKNPSTSTCTDHTTFSETAADAVYRIVPPISLTLGGAPGAWDTKTTASLQNAVMNFKNQDGTPTINIYACIVTAASVTPGTTGDLDMTIGGIND